MSTEKRQASETTGITWGSIPYRKGFKRVPEWYRTVGVDKKGDVWVSAGLGGSEMMVFLCSGYDREPAVQAEGHLYVRAAWMRREFASTAEVLDSIERRVRDWAVGGFQD